MIPFYLLPWLSNFNSSECVFLIVLEFTVWYVSNHCHFLRCHTPSGGGDPQQNAPVFPPFLLCLSCTL